MSIYIYICMILKMHAQSPQWKNDEFKKKKKGSFQEKTEQI